jgi:hypothetical protein
MKKMLNGWSLVGLVAVVAVTVTLISDRGVKARGGASEDVKSASMGGARYTVIETQGYNLLVTDNAANTLYYYATDKDVPVGSPLKLRASLDLSKVGEKELTLKPHDLENIRKKGDK